jgi:hypothetical protein
MTDKKERRDNKWVRRRELPETPMKDQQEAHRQWLQDKGLTKEEYQEKIAMIRQKWTEQTDDAGGRVYQTNDVIFDLTLTN